MSDQDGSSDVAATAATDDAGDSDATGGQQAHATGDDDRGPAGGDKAVLADLARERRERKTLQKQIDELKQRDMSDLDKARHATSEAEKRAAAAEASALRLRVGLSNNIPAEHLHRLQGSNEDELTADAKELAKLLKPTGPRPDPSQGSRADRGRPTDMNALIRQAAGL